MNDILTDFQNGIFTITFNRVAKHNAFDEVFLGLLQLKLDEANHNPSVKALLLKANGLHFSAGADAAWMQRMAHFTEAENLKDAQGLAKVMHSLYESPKPTIAMVQGAAFGGGAGLVAACDIAIAASSSCFCFSEVKLGLIPATISPYVIKAIGERAAKWLFISAEKITAEQAKGLQLVQHVVADHELEQFTRNYVEKLMKLAPLAQQESKRLVKEVAPQTINEPLLQYTAELIAKKRQSKEGQRGLEAFLKKQSPNWN